MNLVDYYAGKLGKGVPEIMDAAAFMVGPDGPVAFRWDEAVLGPRPDPADLDKIEALPDPAPSADALIAYTNAKQWALAAGGFTAVVGRTKIPLSTDELSLAALDRKAARLAGADAPASVSWQTGPTSFAEIKAADFVKVAAQVDVFVQATFDALPPIFAGIKDGSIKTFAAIDKANWPKATGTSS